MNCYKSCIATVTSSQKHAYNSAVPSISNPLNGMTTMSVDFRHFLLPFFFASSLAMAGNTYATDPGERIVGGFELDIQNAPATVALLARNRVETDGDLFLAQFCGGTLIDAEWVLTAAHCLVDRSNTPVAADTLLVLLGSSDLRNPVNQPVNVTQVIVHEDYQDTSSGKDIALLKLEIEATEEPIALNAHAVSLQDQALVAGWGAVNSGSDGTAQSFPSELRGAFVEMTPGDMCGELFPAYAGNTDSTNICAGVPQGGIDSCQGDSGGPLYRVTGDDQTLVAVAGITSWGIGCANARFPGVYTNVSSYVDWVFANTGSAAITTFDSPANTQEPQVPSEIPPLPDPPEPSEIPPLPEPPEPLPPEIQPEPISPPAPSTGPGLNIIPLPFSTESTETAELSDNSDKPALVSDNSRDFLGASNALVLLLLGILQWLRVTNRRLEN